MKSHFDLVQTIGRSGQRDIVSQERCLQFEFVWLDDQALKAANKWRFLPGRRLGETVPVLVTIELTFTLR